MMAALMIAGAVGASTGLFALWSWAVERVVERQEAEMVEDLRRGRW